MSADYLLKTEPSEYSFENLQRDGATVWDGVSNPTAVKNLREMTPGTRLIIYETGDRKSAVGTAADGHQLLGRGESDHCCRRQQSSEDA